MEMRETVKDKEDQQKLKSKTRERMQPKTGKLDIDYQKLHDAFFKFQTKPRLTRFGEVCVAWPPLPTECVVAHIF
jgi:splicing factor 3B subunit 2